MSEYRIFETDEFSRSLEKLPGVDVGFIRDKLMVYAYPQLREMPFYGTNIRKLRGYKPETWRYRIGSYRVFFRVDDQARIVFMLTVDKRSEAYR